jgi:hypothetical protein
MSKHYNKYVIVVEQEEGSTQQQAVILDEGTKL